MGQLSSRLRSSRAGRHAHWCPGCEEMHVIPARGWTFDGNVETPSFHPSVKHTGLRTVVVDGRWTGEWVLDAAGTPIPHCCHYFLTAGELRFCSDSTHPLAGRTVALPELPAHLADEDI